jgi:hypothetical protein
MLRNERGGGRLGVIFWLLLMAAGIFVAIRTIPARVAVLELHDFADAEVQHAGTMPKIKEEEIFKRILDKAKELNVPLTKKDLDLDVRPNDVRLTMKHRVTVNLEVYELTWDFNEQFNHLRM